MPCHQPRRKSLASSTSCIGDALAWAQQHRPMACGDGILLHWRPFSSFSSSSSTALWLQGLEKKFEVWRAYLGWSLSGISLFLVMPMAMLAFCGHCNRDRIDPELIRQHQYEPKELRRNISLGIAGAVAAAPPIIRYILSLFGWEP